MKKLLSLAGLGMFLLVPVATMTAQDHSHQWNDGENPTWHQYLKERHKKDHDWAKATKREQSDYWKWRDQHPDKH